MCLLPLGWASFDEAGGVGRDQGWPAGSKSLVRVSNGHLRTLGLQIQGQSVSSWALPEPPTAPSLAVIYRNAGETPIGVIWTLLV